MDAWIDRELEGCPLPDERLGKRLHKVLEQLSYGISNSLPLACQDWASTKAAYRFFDNPRVDESSILAGHFQATQSRFAASRGTTLVLHDTTEFSYQRANHRAIGKTHTTIAGIYKDGRPRLRTVCGLLMHSSLVVTTDGVPLGLAAIKFWTRKKFKRHNALKHTFNHARIPIEQKESIRWVQNVKQSTHLLGQASRCVHIGDRESDIFELFCAAQEISTFFLVRTCVDRLAQDGNVTILKEMKKQPVQGTHRIMVRDRQGQSSQATLQIQYVEMKVLPPIGKHKQYPALSLTVIHAKETNEPKGRDRIDWKLLTNLPIKNLRQAIEKLNWYAMRWKMEVFHKILKSGCRAEESKLRTAGRLTNLLSIYCILAWRVFWLCMINRADPDAPATLVLTTTECQLLDHVCKTPCATTSKNISHYLHVIARLGGYLDRKQDSPPGNMVLWRGLARLTDIHLGFTLGAKIVGN